MSGISQLCIGGNRLFLRNQGVQALDMKNGKSLWSFESTGCSPLTYADSRIWFVDANNKGHLVALHENNGKKTLDLRGIRSCNAFIERDGKGYVKTHDGAIHVVLLKS
jgi:outer membrane protein assembly factor BamB